MKDRLHYWIAALALITGTIQIVLATRQCLWSDEIFSLATATGHSLEHRASAARPELGDFVEGRGPLPPAEWRRYLEHSTPAEPPSRVVRAVLLSDTSPPLYYLLLYAWTRVIGTTDLAVRLFSIACAIASLPLLASVARRTVGSSGVLPACILFSFSPLEIYYATEARMYSLLVLWVITTAYLSLLLRERGAGNVVSVLWVISSAAGLLTHYFFLFPWLALVGYLIISPGKLRRSQLIYCVIATGLLAIPWYLVAVKWWKAWRITGGWLHIRPAGFHRARALRNHFLQFYSAAGSRLWPYHRWPSVAATLLFGGLAAFAVWRLRARLFQGTYVMLWLWFIAACVAPTVLDIAGNTYGAGQARYALAALPAAYLLAVIPLTLMPFRMAIVFTLLILLFWSPALRGILRPLARDDEPFRQIAALLDARAKQRDVILVHSIPSGILGIARYMEGSTGLAPWVGQLRTRQVPESLHEILSGHQRCFFVAIHTVGEPAPEEQWLRANGVVTLDQRLTASRLIEFRPNNSNAFSFRPPGGE